MMGKRKDWRDSAGVCPPSPPASPPTMASSRPSTPSTPVQIPNSTKGATAHPQKRHSAHYRRRPNQISSSDDISPSVAALLAVTSIPRQRGSLRRRRRGDKVMTTTGIIDEQQVSEKELSWSLGKETMDMLLSPPEEAMDDDLSISDCNIGSALSTRTLSVDSIPSLGDSFATDAVSSLGTPLSRSSSLRGRRMSPTRRSLEPCLSPPGEEHDHPLARKPMVADREDEENSSQASADTESLSILQPFKPFKSAFKSNLTASLRALRSAAKSISTINFSSIPSDDFLTRSLLTMDANVPYADERRPPVMEDIPSAETRRYLNPTSSSRIETQLAVVPPAGTFSASIQMQTYKVHRSKGSSSRSGYPRASLHASADDGMEEGDGEAKSELQVVNCVPGMRQREVRENSDFIRIAVMEMAMRKRGKLDDARPGRARWTLPPRKTSTTTAYEIGPDGVPARWASTTCVY